MYRPGKFRQVKADSEVPGSLDGVLNSLETLLEHRSHTVPESVQEAMESFADSMGEQYDDPLVPDLNSTQSREPTEVEIPVLHDIVQAGDAIPAKPGNEDDLDALLETLRKELDHLVDDIIDDARDHFSQSIETHEAGEQLSFADQVSDFMRDALARRQQDK